MAQLFLSVPPSLPPVARLLTGASCARAGLSYLGPEEEVGGQGFVAFRGGGWVGFSGFGAFGGGRTVAFAGGGFLAFAGGAFVLLWAALGSLTSLDFLASLDFKLENTSLQKSRGCDARAGRGGGRGVRFLPLPPALPAHPPLKSRSMYLPMWPKVLSQ